MTVKILIFNNKSDFFPDLKGYLDSLGVDVRITNPLQKFPNDDYNGIIISGGIISRDNYKESLRWYRELLRTVQTPVLGICLGHIILGRSYGATWKKMAEPETGVVTIEFDESYPLVPDVSSLTVYQDHEKELVHLPDCLSSYGSSPTCRVQTITHNNRPQFSVQFHPEITDGNEGYLILDNFIDYCKQS